MRGLAPPPERARRRPIRGGNQSATAVVRRFPGLWKIGYNEGSKRGWVFSSSRRTAVANLGPSVVRTVSHALFSLFFPDNCHVCERPLTEVTRVPVCRHCLRQPEPLEAEFFCVSCRTPFLNGYPLDSEGRCAVCRAGLRGFDSAYCFGAYDGTLRQLIHLYKYGRIRTLWRPLAGLLGRALPLEARFDAVTPVPLHWRRQWQRGFNQSDLLARALARPRCIPVVHALRRVRATQAQAGLCKADRRRNVATAFRCQPAAQTLVGKTVLLVDDVMTTGSTAAACARVLKQAGVAKVVLATVARANRRMPAASPETQFEEGENS